MKPIIDLSSWENPALIDYDLLVPQISGAILRGVYSNSKDTTLDWHYEEFMRRSVPIGVYHLFTEGPTVEEQVNVFALACASKTFSMGYWADVENTIYTLPLRKQTVHSYMQLAESTFGVPFGIYTSKNYWNQIMAGAYYTDHKLWVAAYLTDIYKYMPMGWSDYWLWQFSDGGRFAGFSGAIDMSEFRYGEQEFAQWIGGIPIPPSSQLKLYRPCDSWATITQVFGANPQWYATSRGHNGVDFGFYGTIGHPIYCANDGVVETSGEFYGGYGRHIRVRHAGGVTIYGHLSKRLVEVGAQVKGCQVIGLSGGNLEDPYCGYSTGPHLHFEYRQNESIPNPTAGQFVYNAIDPMPYLVEHEEVDVLYQVQVIVNVLNVRSGVGTGYPVVRTVKLGDILDVYEVANGWLRIGDGEWCSGSSSYVKQFTPPDNRLDILWDAHPELH